MNPAARSLVAAAAAKHARAAQTAQARANASIVLTGLRDLRLARRAAVQTRAGAVVHEVALIIQELGGVARRRRLAREKGILIDQALLQAADLRLELLEVALGRQLGADDAKVIDGRAVV